MKKKLILFKELLFFNKLVPVALTGLILSLLLSWSLVFVYLNRDFSPQQRRDNSFRRELEKYDAALSRLDDSETEKLLFRLQRRADSQDQILSVLKRWRQLAITNPQFLSGYDTAVHKLFRDNPHFENLAALAIEVNFLYEKHGLALPEPQKNHIPADVWAQRITMPHFDALLLSYYILNGNFRRPLDAVSIQGILELMASANAGFEAQIKTELRICEILLRILLDDKRLASLMINNLILENPQDQKILSLGAEYFYDNESFLYSAYLFSRLRNVFNLSREADALSLAGEIPAARNIWTLLSSPSANPLTHVESVPEEIVLRSLYNLSATTENADEAGLILERLFALGGGGPNPALTYGIIRYTRLLDSDRSIAILTDSDDPILELELLRRRLSILPRPRWVPEIWQLLERHNETEEVYRWGAAYFEYQKLFEENTQLLRIAERHQFKGAWLPLHQGLAQLREGRHEAGEAKLKEALNLFPDFELNQYLWVINANLGRLYEARRNFSDAAYFYEQAAKPAGATTESAMVYLRLSRSYDQLGRLEDSLEALERARELAPDNINIRHELSRRQ